MVYAHITLGSDEQGPRLYADGKPLYIGLARTQAECQYTDRTVGVGREAWVLAAGEADDVLLLPWAGTELLSELRCLQAHEGGCEGRSEYRTPLSGTGRPFPRCEGHWAERLDREAEIRERYPEHAPADWSPLDAGEAWGPEDY